MRKFPLLLILCLLLLTSCNLPTGPVAGTPTGDAVATQVAQLLTAVPTFTNVPAEATQAPSATPVPATPTTLPTATQPQPAATNTVVPTLPSGDPKNSLGTPAWTYDFNSGKAFYLYENENTRVTMENSALLLTGLNANGWMGWSLTYSHPAQNFYLEGTFSPQTCSGADLYGLVFRAPRADAGYFFEVTCDGRYSLHARDFTAGSDSTVVDMTRNSAIQAGSNQVNRLGVMANGDKISLYANGVLLNEITESSFNVEGDFGALVAANATAGFTVKLEEISLWKLP